ncbi:MAG: hypothetical protein AVDCRST_MAG79-2166 [uncultured Thermoleophilia bacterium]|uniref:Uncharacterized protein n=1 Tax=uncultured Thermoleophilia bacterium TaxID=1497501 RepID=A0A6J4UA92_9ACTN|nr:MAG: hypothetical protein AVDCRST_MAG79-2166 [uncultured Thermoleophilia bacterium]
MEQELLGLTDPAAIARAFEDVARVVMGVPVSGGLFYASSAGTVCGLVLADGRRIVVKASRDLHPAAVLGAVRDVQAALAAGGFPAPPPLAGPVPFGRGLAVIDGYRPGGVADAHDPAVRDAMARTLAALVREGGAILAERRRDLAVLALERRPGRPAPGALWGVPHSPIFDLAATHAGAEWIDAVARPAQAVVADPAGERVLGHIDWSVKNLGWDGASAVAVYDWDSLAVAAEPVILGEAARGFTATWELPVEPAPSPEEAAAFVRAYEVARGAPFSSAERRTAAAAALYAAAGIARFEHALTPWPAEYPRGSFRDRLARHGADWFDFGG